MLHPSCFLLFFFFLATLVRVPCLQAEDWSVLLGSFPEDSPPFADMHRASEVQVSYVNPGSAAEKAGLRSGDVVVAVDGVRITSKPEYQLIQYQGRAHQYRIRLHIQRNNQLLSITAWGDQLRRIGFTFALEQPARQAFLHRVTDATAAPDQQRWSALYTLPLRIIAAWQNQADLDAGFQAQQGAAFLEAWCAAIRQDWPSVLSTHCDQLPEGVLQQAYALWQRLAQAHMDKTWNISLIHRPDELLWYPWPIDTGLPLGEAETLPWMRAFRHCPLYARTDPNAIVERVWNQLGAAMPSSDPACQEYLRYVALAILWPNAYDGRLHGDAVITDDKRRQTLIERLDADLASDPQNPLLLFARFIVSVQEVWRNKNALSLPLPEHFATEGGSLFQSLAAASPHYAQRALFSVISTMQAYRPYRLEREYRTYSGLIARDLSMGNVQRDPLLAWARPRSANLLFRLACTSSIQDMTGTYPAYIAPLLRVQPRSIEELDRAIANLSANAAPDVVERLFLEWVTIWGGYLEADRLADLTALLATQQVHGALLEAFPRLIDQQLVNGNYSGVPQLCASVLPTWIEADDNIVRTRLESLPWNTAQFADSWRQLCTQQGHALARLRFAEAAARHARTDLSAESIQLVQAAAESCLAILNRGPYPDWLRARFLAPWLSVLAAHPETAGLVPRFAERVLPHLREADASSRPHLAVALAQALNGQHQAAFASVLASAALPDPSPDQPAQVPGAWCPDSQALRAFVLQTIAQQQPLSGEQQQQLHTAGLGPNAMQRQPAASDDALEF